KLYYERIEHAVNIIVEEEMRLSYQIYKEERDERVNNEITKRYMHRDTVVDKMKQLHRAVYNFCMSLKTNTLDIHKYEKIDYLMDRQHNFFKETASLNTREKKCTQQYVDLQRLLMQLEIESQRKLNDLRLEHAYFLNERKAIKYKMKIDTDITFEKLRILGATSYDVIRRYRDLKKKGDLLLSLAAMCRQYETQSEKIVPWQEAERPIGYREQEQEIFRLQTLDLKMHVDLTEADLLEQFKILKNFWRRQSLVELQNLLLTDEKNRLLEENKKYCDFIKAMNKTEDENELLKALTVTNVLPAPGLPCRNFFWRGRRKK
ncbi:dynein regulatory complex subunit 2-like, partial [Teleopsis dalmanni]